MKIFSTIWEAMTRPKLQLTSRVAQEVQRLQLAGRQVVCNPSFSLLHQGEMRLPRTFLECPDEFARSLDDKAKKIVPTVVTGYKSRPGNIIFSDGKGGITLIPQTYYDPIHTPRFLDCHGVVTGEVLPDTSKGLFVPVGYYGRKNLALREKLRNK